MIVTIVHVWVRKDRINDFIKATTENQKQSVRESGNLRFDLLQGADDSTKFIIYEAYKSEEASLAHKSTNHYKKWRDVVAGWMAQPRRGDKHLIITPIDESQW